MPTANAIVFVLDPDPRMRTWLAAVIQRGGWTHESLECAGALLARRTVAAPTCVVLNVGSPDVGAFEVLRRLAAERQETPIVAIADHGDVPMTVRAMKAGASEFLTTPLANETLLPAIDCALAKSSAILDRTSELRELRGRFESLSGRERAVMTRVVAGDLNKRIGAALGITEITVKAHRGKAMRKMRAESLAELVSMAMRLEVTPPQSAWSAIHA